MSAARSPIDGPLDSGSNEPASLVLPEALAASTPYPGRPTVEVHETHASWVFLAGAYAYKVKKPVRLAFLDYSTLSRRLAACREEVRVNEELAPDIYLGVRAIVRTPAGLRFAPEATPDAVEYAVHMRRFDEAQTLRGAIRAGSLTRTQVREVAGCLADFHRRAPAIAGGGPARVLDAWRTNVEELARLAHPRAWRVEVLRGFGEAFVSAHAVEIEQRAQAGHVRDGHGDLRCEHVLLGRPVRVVDRIEFDRGLREVDVACDLAFLAMDLEAHRRRWAARELVGAYRRAGGSPGSDELRCFYGAHWALVRAKVALVAATTSTGHERRGELAQAERMWKLAQRLCWRARRPLAIVVCGPAASGKSTLAGELARRSEFPLVASDVVRKRLAGLSPTERAQPEHYTSAFTRATYELANRDALAKLERSGGVIIDATCHSKGQRALLFRGLNACSATFLVVHCRVKLETALARTATRMRSPERISDATPQVVAAQFRRFQALDELSQGSVLVLDAERSIEAQTTDVMLAVDARIGASARAGTPALAPRVQNVRAFPHPNGAFTR